MNISEIKQMKVIYIMDQSTGKSRLSLYNEQALKIDNDISNRSFPIVLLIKGLTSTDSDKYGRMFRLGREGHVIVDPSTQIEDVTAKKYSYELLVWYFDMLKANEGGNKDN